MLPNSVRYSPELADEICARTIAGQSIAEICRSADMPSEAAFYKWLAEDRDGIVERYARAKAIQADVFAESVVPIADEVAGCTDNAIVQAARLRIDARKWAASKLAPKKYGERTVITGANDTPLIPANTATPDRVAAVFLALAEKLPRVRAIEHSKDDETDG